MARWRSGPVDPATFTAILEGKVPDSPRLGKRDRDGNIYHRPGRDVTLSGPKSVSLMALVGGQKMVATTFRHDTSRNLDPQLHTHCVIANMVQGGDGKWRTMVDDGLYRSKMAIGAIYRAELAQGLSGLGYRIEKTHADGRFEVAGVPRAVIEAFSTARRDRGILDGGRRSRRRWRNTASARPMTTRISRRAPA